MKLLILICTEGKETEKAFLMQVIKVFRINPGIIKFQVKQGAHKALIDNCVQRRKELGGVEGVPEKDIEVWAMCDRDSFNGKYSDLKKYADTKNVRLAFSSPQFESFIMQMFIKFGHDYKGAKLTRELSKYLRATKLRNGKELRSSYDKSDLKWVGSLLDEKHSMLDAAIRNAGQFNSQTKKPFFTVQDLIKRILEFKS